MIFAPVPGRAGVRSVPATRLAADGASGGACLVVEEDVLTIEVEDVGTYALMWTPTEAGGRAVGYTVEDGVLADAGGVPEALALAAGFAFTEGIIDRREDIAHMSVCPDRPDVLRMRLADPAGATVRRRDVVVNSSCGICGGRERVREHLAANCRVGDMLRLSVTDFAPLREAMRRQQEIFNSTGGAHGAAIFDAALRLVATAEDLGRHNALDKAIGQHFLAGGDFAGCGVFISSRISYEMVAKSVRAGFELIAAISAPSSMAIETADRFGITLCGFVRDEGAKLYTHPHRIATD